MKHIAPALKTAHQVCVDRRASAQVAGAVIAVGRSKNRAFVELSAARILDDSMGQSINESKFDCLCRMRMAHKDAVVSSDADWLAKP